MSFPSGCRRSPLTSCCQQRTFLPHWRLVLMLPPGSKMLLYRENLSMCNACPITAQTKIWQGTLQRTPPSANTIAALNQSNELTHSCSAGTMGARLRLMETTIYVLPFKLMSNVPIKRSLELSKRRRNDRRKDRESCSSVEKNSMYASTSRIRRSPSLPLCFQSISLRFFHKNDRCLCASTMSKKNDWKIYQKGALRE